MIQIQQLKLSITHSNQDLRDKICRMLKISREQLLNAEIVRRSIDARKKEDISYVYTVKVQVRQEEKIVNRIHSNRITLTKQEKYALPKPGSIKLDPPPVIVGSGPAGLFCGYLLSKMGYAPVILERGSRIEERTRDVEKFWKTGKLNPDSNASFGEGGAGTFSDGKLNTLVKDKGGRNRKVLDIFIRNGAPEEIAYEAKPHMGTDRLSQVIPSIRREIESMGGKFFFHTCMTDVKIHQGKIQRIQVNHDQWLDTRVLILATGHSARDTFQMLYDRKVPMESKAFAVGFRVEHPQEMINVSQYGREASKILPPAPYKVTANLPAGRGVYSFCMCPGGYVVNASSQEGYLAVNGMSYYKRDGRNANSAVIVSVSPKDFGRKGPLSGIDFQRELEEKAYKMGQGAIPQQLYGDFKNQKISTGYGIFSSCTKGKTVFAPLHRLFPKEINDSFIRGMEAFAGKIPGFNREDVILSGVESRTSSPVRILRDKEFESEVEGIYPCGEGAGYAGGIMSAAMDGLKVAEAVISLYAPKESSDYASTEKGLKHGQNRF